MSEHVVLRIGIAILGACGFWVARHIYKKKRSSNPFVCPIKFDCNSVVNSDYSRLFGIPLEILGMVYYGFIAVSYCLSSLYLYYTAHLPLGFIVILMIGLSVFAFLFSIYLIGVQAFILKNWCFWCIVSACISVSIFILTFLSYNLISVARTLY